MPRAGAGSGSGRSSSGHDGGSRMSSGHRPSMPGSGRRAGGGGSAGFPQSSGPTGSGGFDVGDLFRAAGIGMAGGYNAGRRSTRNRYGRRSMPFPEEIFDAMGQQPNYGRQQTPGSIFGRPLRHGCAGRGARAVLAGRWAAGGPAHHANAVRRQQQRREKAQWRAHRTHATDRHPGRARHLPAHFHDAQLLEQ